jgi:hypothetical protein
MGNTLDPKLFGTRGHVVPPLISKQEMWDAMQTLKKDPKSEMSQSLAEFYKNLPNDTEAADVELSIALGSLLSDTSSHVQAAGIVDESASLVFRAAFAAAQRYVVARLKPGRAVAIRDLKGDSIWSGMVPTREQAKQSADLLEKKPSDHDEFRLQAVWGDLFILDYAVTEGGAVPGNLMNTLQLLDIAQFGLGHVIYVTKMESGVPRPSKLVTGLEPVLSEPKHSSWPSGHAFASGITAAVLSLFVQPQVALKVRKGAARVGVNRERASLHTRLDTVSGFELGSVLAQDFVQSLLNAAIDTKGLEKLVERARSEWPA